MIKFVFWLQNYKKKLYERYFALKKLNIFLSGTHSGFNDIDHIVA